MQTALCNVHNYDTTYMYVPCKSCSKMFNNLSEGVQYSGVKVGFLAFCSDNCCKNYLNSSVK